MEEKHSCLNYSDRERGEGRGEREARVRKEGEGEAGGRADKLKTRRHLIIMAEKQTYDSFVSVCGLSCFSLKVCNTIANVSIPNADLLTCRI